jgi:hypothetical protein
VETTAAIAAARIVCLSPERPNDFYWITDNFTINVCQIFKYHDGAYTFRMEMNLWIITCVSKEEIPEIVIKG